MIPRAFSLLGVLVLLRALLKAFEDEDCLPVSVDKVREVVVNLGAASSVTFHEGDVRADVLRGMLVVFEPLARPYAEQPREAIIILSRDLADDWRRMTATKELVNVLDPPRQVTNSLEGVEHLIERMSLAMDLQGINPQEWHDRAAEFIALAVLVPMHLRDFLRDQHASGRFDHERIAEIAQIPRKYVALILLDNWPELVETLVSSFAKDAVDLAARRRSAGR